MNLKPNVEIFGVKGSELVGADEPDDGIEVAPLVGQMTQEEFAEEIAALINYILDYREDIKQANKGNEYVSGGAGGGGGIAVDAILMG